MKKFRRTELITILILFLITIPILVFTIINNRTLTGDIVSFLHYWIWNPVIFLTLPVFIINCIFAFVYYSPMAFYSKTRYKGAVGLMVTSYIFATVLWIYSLGVVWIWENVKFTVIGLCLGYVGVIPVAVVVAFMSGYVGFLIPMAVLVVCFILTRNKMKNALLYLNSPEDGEPGRL